MRKRLDPAPSQSLTSLGDLLRQRGVQVSEEESPPPAPPASAEAPSDAGLARARLVLRRERKGHGGKTVTIVEGLQLPAAELERVARELRKALGCGARVDGTRIVVQGDSAAAVERWLRARGASRIVQGN